MPAVLATNLLLFDITQQRSLLTGSKPLLQLQSHRPCSQIYGCVPFQVGEYAVLAASSWYRWTD